MPCVFFGQCGMHFQSGNNDLRQSNLKLPLGQLTLAKRSATRSTRRHAECASDLDGTVEGPEGTSPPRRDKPTCSISANLVRSRHQAARHSLPGAHRNRRVLVSSACLSVGSRFQKQSATGHQGRPGSARKGSSVCRSIALHIARNIFLASMDPAQVFKDLSCHQSRRS